MPYKPSKLRLPQNIRKLESRTLEAQKHIVDSVGNFTRKHTKYFRRRIRDQRFQSFIDNPLSPGWLARKLAANADERVHIATGHYVKNIKATTIGNLDGEKVQFAIRPDPRVYAINLKRKKTNLRLSALAAILESGSESGNLPPRPHWRPYRSVIRTDAKRLRSELRKDVYLILRGHHEMPLRT